MAALVGDGDRDGDDTEVMFQLSSDELKRCALPKFSRISWGFASASKLVFLFFLTCSSFGNTRLAVFFRNGDLLAITSRPLKATSLVAILEFLLWVNSDVTDRTPTVFSRGYLVAFFMFLTFLNSIFSCMKIKRPLK